MFHGFFTNFQGSLEDFSRNCLWGSILMDFSKYFLRTVRALKLQGLWNLFIIVFEKYFFSWIALRIFSKDCQSHYLLLFIIVFQEFRIFQGWSENTRINRIVDLQESSKNYLWYYFFYNKGRFSVEIFSGKSRGITRGLKKYIKRLSSGIIKNDFSRTIRNT